MSEIIIIASGKGGTGKSSFTAGCGVALAEYGKRVLLIDADAGLRSLDLILGLSEQTVYDLGDILTGRCEPVKAIYPVADAPGLSLIPAPQAYMPSLQKEEMRRLCQGLLKYYDILLIDAPAGIGEGLSFSAAAATRGIIVATPDPVSIRSGHRAAQSLAQAGVSDRRLVINRYQPRILTAGVVDDLDVMIDHIGIQLLGVVMEDEKVPLYAAQGKPLKKSSPASDAFRRIAGRIIGQEILLPIR